MTDDYKVFNFRNLEATIKLYYSPTIGHIQYISTIIKENRTHYRHEYGIKFLLDVILTHYR